MGRPMATPPRAWQRMLSGRRLNLLDPSPLDIEIEDIAHGLSRVARWNGQTIGEQAFSVAQHSLLVEAIAGRLGPQLTRHELLHVLLHDAAEFVIGDLISPFKAMLADDYRQVENRLMTVVAQRFGLGIASLQLLQLTKKADRIAAFHEATVLAGFSEKDAIAVFGAMPKLPGIVATMLEPLPPREAKLRFLERFEALLKPAGT
jgi:uncharacterized protein